jgi:hypothetical protein
MGLEDRPVAGPVILGQEVLLLENGAQLAMWREISWRIWEHR